MMTTIRWAGVAVMVLAAFTVPAAAAQERAVAGRDTVELTRAEIQARRQEIVQELMGLTPEESERFWPVYREYRNDVAKVTDEKVTLAEQYLSSYDSLSDKQAEDLLKNWFKLRDEHMDVQEDYVGRFRKVLPPQKVLRFYQIENTLDAIVGANLQASLLMGP